MTEPTLLAAVHAAAQSNVPAADAASQPKEIQMADTAKPAGAAAEVKPTTAAELASAFPELVTQIRADAATAERDRIAGIDRAIGPRKLPAEMVARMKADATCTPEKAALQIVEHENSQREAAAANIKGVEDEAAKIKAAPSAAGGGDKVAVPQTRDGWKAEYEASDKLKSEFATADDYASFMANQNNVRILGRKSA
jgi:hypothetical protein